MRGLRAARRTGHHVSGTHRMNRVPDVQLAFAFEYEEHLLVDSMVVSGEGALARRNGCNVIAELLRAELARNLGHARRVAFRRSARRRKTRGKRLHLDVVDVDDGARHESSFVWVCRS